ncbi:MULTISPECIES: response regulator transcription factor [unclassified Streptomyces]|uniref:response regulator transcription factor n=1 Tax=unclassified Streptomyces TaxID=2593676 RepID=UPI0036A2B3E1
MLLGVRGLSPGGCSISENSVKNHVRNILEKLQLHSRMEAVVYAMREKILEIR